MNIYAVGIDYKTASLEVREKFGLTRQEQKKLLQLLSAVEQAEEAVVISTCNRMEAYVCADGLEAEPADGRECPEAGRTFCRSLAQMICSVKGIEFKDVEELFNFYCGSGAVRHLFRVTAGLESQVLGEDQILGQVKAAHETAQEEETVGSVLNTLFREVVTTAKKIKTCTELSKNPVSTASLAVRLISEVFGGRLAERKALIIGTGRIGTIAMENLLEKGVGKVYATKRLHPGGHEPAADRPQQNGQPVKVEIVDYNERYRYIADCDIIISATESPHFTITRESLEKVLGGEDIRNVGKSRSRESGIGLESGPGTKVFVDLAVPRDIDCTITGLDNIRYFNIDDLKLASDENLEKRAEEALKAEEWIAGAVGEFEKWMEYKEAVPVIREIRKFADGVVENRSEYLSGKLKNAGEDELELVRASMAGAVNEVLNKLVYSIRECGTKEDIQSYFRCLREVILTSTER